LVNKDLPGLIDVTKDRVYIFSMAQLIETGRHRTKRQLEGIVPPGAFLPGDVRQGYAFSFGTISASLKIWDLALSYLGLPRFRLWVILGGEPTVSWRTGRTKRLSQLYMTRLAYLFYLKGTGINTSAFYAVDWEKGIVYFEQGQPVNLPIRPLSTERAREKEPVLAK